MPRSGRFGRARAPRPASTGSAPEASPQASVEPATAGSEVPTNSGPEAPTDRGSAATTNSGSEAATDSASETPAEGASGQPTHSGPETSADSAFEAPAEPIFTPAPEPPFPPPEAPPGAPGGPGPPGPEFPPELEGQATQHRGGWVYEADDGAAGADFVAAKDIRRAWQIGEDGRPTGQYVDNRHYRGEAQVARRGSRRRLLIPLALILVAAVAALVVVLATSGGHHRTAPPPLTQQSSPSHTKPQSADPAPRPAGRPSSARATKRRTSAPPASAAIVHASPATSSVKLVLTASSRVYVCLVDVRAHVLVNGRILAAGSTTPVYTAVGFRLFAGAEGLTAEVNGRRHRIVISTVPAGVSITPDGLAPLPAGTVAPCA